MGWPLVAQAQSRPGVRGRLWLVGCGAALAEVKSCSSDHVLARQMLECHIQPGYNAVQAKAAMLKSTLAQACAAHDGAALGAVRSAYRDALLAWSHVEHLRFGPVVDDNIFERIVFWPDRQGIGVRQVRKILAAKDASATDVASLHKKSVAVQGYTALEVLLYGKVSDQLMADNPAGRHACGYATAIASNVSTMIDDVVAGWSAGGKFASLWLTPGEHNPVYKTASDTTYEALKSYRFAINIPREQKLLPALGLKRHGASGPYLPKTKPPFTISGLGMSTIIANTEAAIELVEQGGLAERLAVKEPETADLIKSELQNVLRIMREVEGLGNAAFEEPAAKKLALAREPFISALIAGGEALATDCGMVLGFSDEDGD
ncbi:MAG: imelysin family protein [Hyphomicrobiaceae bacterium]